VGKDTLTGAEIGGAVAGPIGAAVGGLFGGGTDSVPWLGVLHHLYRKGYKVRIIVG
jgi:hypothetical protein